MFFDDAVFWLNDLTGAGFSLHGWIAFILGTAGVVGLNVGLMWLVVRSNRGGHDVAADDVAHMTKKIDRGE